MYEQLTLRLGTVTSINVVCVLITRWVHVDEMQRVQRGLLGRVVVGG